MYRLFLLTGLILCGCANPDYIDPAQTVKKNDNSPAALSCPLNFSAAQLCASLHWSQGPQSPAESEFILKFWDSKTSSENGPYKDPSQNITAVLWMPSMGHGSSPVKIEKIEPGVYRVRKVYFIMPGDWEVRLSLKNADGTSELQTLKLVL